MEGIDDVRGPCDEEGGVWGPCSLGAGDRGPYGIVTARKQSLVISWMSAEPSVVMLRLVKQNLVDY